MELLKQSRAVTASRFAKIEKSSFLPVIAITILAAILRLAFILPTDFPLNDGGLFFAMTQDLIRSGFALPAYTSYNLANIPYAYPPFGFYLAAGLHQFLHVPLIEIFRFLPLLFNIFTIPVLYLLANELLASQNQAILATIIYAILLPGFQWQIMGGGITRSPAYLFSLIAVFCSIRLFRSPSLLKIFITAFFLSLSVLSHLEIAWVAAVSVGLIWFFLDRKKRGLLNLFFVGVITLLLTLPYWISVIRIQGLSPFLFAFRSGSDNWQWFLSFLILGNFMGDLFFPPIVVIALVASFYEISVRQYILPAWLIVVITIDPRSVGRSMAVPLVLLVAAGLDQIILPGISGRQNDSMDRRTVVHGKLKRSRETSLTSLQMMFLILFVFYSIFSIYLFYHQDDSGLVSLSSADRKAMKWISENTEMSSKFLILTDHQDWITDMQAEWFPVLANRVSVMTVQGNEWLGGDRFNAEKSAYKGLMDCSYRGMTCLNSWMDMNNKQSDYLVIFRSDPQPGSPPASRWENVENELRTGKSYAAVYRNTEATVFRRKIVQEVP